MAKYNTIRYKLVYLASKIITKMAIKSNTCTLLDSDLYELRKELLSTPSIVLTRKRNHMSSFVVSLMSFIKTGKWSKYTHAILNINGEKFIEATGKGVHYSSFDEAFKYSGNICVLVPMNMKKDDWDFMLDVASENIGKPYDNFFDMNDDTHLYCTELVLISLTNIDDFDIKFESLIDDIRKTGNLTPQMLRDSEVFNVTFEV